MDGKDWDAQAYSQASEGQYIWAQELIGLLELFGDESLLDIGCGDGKVTVSIAMHLPGGQVVGIDSSPEMIDLAQKRWKETGIEFRLLDATMLDYGKCFDRIFSNAVLHWVSDHNAVLGGIHRALKPGGKAVLQMGGEGNARDILAVMSGVMRSKQWQEYFHDFHFPYTFHGVAHYETMLKAAGFSHFEVRLVPKDMLHKDMIALRGWIETTWFPYIRCIPPALQKNFVDAFVEAYIRHSPPDEQGIHVAMVRLEVEAYE